MKKDEVDIMLEKVCAAVRGLQVVNVGGREEKYFRKRGGSREDSHMNRILTVYLPDSILSQFYTHIYIVCL